MTAKKTMTTLYLNDMERNKMIWKGWAWVAGILLLAACQQEDVEHFAPEAGGNEFTLTMQSDRMLPTPVTTKASDPKEDAEKEIRNAVANEMRHFGNVVARFSFFVKIKMLAAKSKIA